MKDVQHLDRGKENDVKSRIVKFVEQKSFVDDHK